MNDLKIIIAGLGNVGSSLINTIALLSGIPARKTAEPYGLPTLSLPTPKTQYLPGDKNLKEKLPSSPASVI